MNSSAGDVLTDPSRCPFDQRSAGRDVRQVSDEPMVIDEQSAAADWTDEAMAVMAAENSICPKKRVSPKGFRGHVLTNLHAQILPNGHSRFLCPQFCSACD